MLMSKPFSLPLLMLAGSLVPLQAGTIDVIAPGTVNSFFDVFVELRGVFDPPHDIGDSFVGYGFDVAYDNTILSYLGEEPGPLFTDLSGIPGITAQVAGFATAGFLDPGPGTPDPLRLATLHFRAVGSGRTTIGITGINSILTPDQGAFYLFSVDNISGSVSVDAIPEPGTFLLVSLAAAALPFGSQKAGSRAKPPSRKEHNQKRDN